MKEKPPAAQYATVDGVKYVRGDIFRRLKLKANCLSIELNRLNAIRRQEKARAALGLASLEVKYTIGDAEEVAVAVGLDEVGAYIEVAVAGTAVRVPAAAMPKVKKAIKVANQLGLAGAKP